MALQVEYQHAPSQTVSPSKRCTTRSRLTRSPLTPWVALIASTKVASDTNFRANAESSKGLQLAARDRPHQGAARRLRPPLPRCGRTSRGCSKACVASIAQLPAAQSGISTERSAQIRRRLVRRLVVAWRASSRVTRKASSALAEGSYHSEHPHMGLSLIHI